jgi:hypothetical protein
MTHLPRAILAVASSAAMIASIHGHQQPAEAPPTSVTPCLRDGAKFVGTQPTPARGKARLPKKIKNVEPEYPSLPPGTKGTGIWIAEALIDREGKVVKIWPALEPKLTPPFPAFTDAIVAAVRQWQYEPAILPKLGATPVCRFLAVTPKWK